MKHFIYTIFVCLFVLTGCDSEEPGYGYKDPVVYFSRAGILEVKYRYPFIAAGIRIGDR